jgi:GntR family transcriptional regulator
MISLVISPQSPDPLYKQVMDQIKDGVAGGVLKPGERLPSIREMAKELNVSEITIKRAYTDLEAEGFVYTRAGLGSFVADVNQDRLRQAKLREIREELRRVLLTARRFGIKPDEVAALLEGLKEE